MKKAPEENFNDLIADLALTVADVLDREETPAGLREALSETIDAIQNAIDPSLSELLRALAGLAKARGGEMWPETETAILAAQSASIGHPEKAIAASQNWQSC